MEPVELKSKDGKKEVKLQSDKGDRTDQGGRARSDTTFNPRDKILEKVNSISQAIKSGFHCRERSDYFYFWSSLTNSILEFCETDALESLKGQYAKVEPFLRYLDDANELWQSRNEAKQASQQSRFEDRLFMNELSLTASFILLIDLSQFKGKYLRRDHPWNYQVFSCIKLKDAKSIQPGRQEDVLFWSRFLGEMKTRVPVRDFTKALFLHLQVVENQKMYLNKEEFHKLTCACLGADPSNDNAMITRDRTESKDCLSWSQFICLYGPTLDQLMPRMCGVTNSKTFTLNQWLDYKISTEEAMDRVNSGKVDFILRLARDKRNFVVHYAAEQNQDDETVFVTLQSKVYLQKKGYVASAPSSGRILEDQSYPSLRDFLILYLCAQFQHLNEQGVALDHEKSDWSMRLESGAYAKKIHQTSADSMEETKRELLPMVGELLSVPDPAGQFEHDFRATIVDRDQIDDHIEIIFEFLENKSTGDARQSESIVIGVFMILRGVYHHLTSRVKNKEKPKFWREDDLLRMIPRNITTMDPIGLKKALLSTSARLYTSLLEEKGNGKITMVDTDHFLSLVASSVALIEREVRAVNEDSHFTSRTEMALRTLQLCFTFPVLAVRSLFWGRGLNLLFMRRKLFDAKRHGWGLYVLKVIASAILVPIIAGIYFAPIVSVILYHIHYAQIRDIATKEITVTIFEVYTPFITMIVFSLVLGVTQGWSVYEAVCAEQRWLTANLMMKGSTTSTLELISVSADSGPSKPTTQHSHSVFNDLEWFFENNELPNVDLDLPIIRVAWSHFKGRRVGLLFVLLVAAAHAVLSVLYRSSWRSQSFKAFPLGDTFYEKTIAIINVVCSFFGVLALSFFLQAAAMHYLRIREWMVKAISLTEVKTAFRKQFKYYLPLYRADNFSYWALLRKAGKQQVDPSMTVIVGLNLVLEVAVVLVLFLRTLVWKDNEKTDLFVAMAVFDICVLSVFLIQIFFVVVSLNEKVHTETLACLQQGKILLARVQNDVNKRLSVVREQEKFVRVRLNRDDTEEVEELNLLKSCIHEKEEELMDIECCEMMLDSTMASMNSLDQPITVLGIVVDTDFVVKLFAIVGSGIVSIIIGLLQSTFSSTTVT